MIEYGYHFQAIVGLQSGKPLACELLLRKDPRTERSTATLSSDFYTENLVTLTNTKIKAIEALSKQHNQWIFLNFTRCEISHLSFNNVLINFLIEEFEDKFHLVLSNFTRFAHEIQNSS